MADSIKHTKVNLYDFFFANKVRKTYTNIGITLVLTIVLVLFAIKPTLTTVQGIKDKTKDYKAQNDKALNKINAEKNLQKQSNFGLNDTPSGLREAIQFLRQAFIKSDSFDVLYTNLYTRANKNNIVIRSLTPSSSLNNSNSTTFDNSIESPSVEFFDVSVNFEAKEMKDVQAFLSSLEGYRNFPIFSRVKTITISNMVELNKAEQNVDQNRQQNIIDFNVVFTVYTSSDQN